jgi:hypothetical protein
VFQDYHLRVGEITADNWPAAGLALLQQRLDETEVGDAKAMTISELPSVGGKPACMDIADEVGMPEIGSLGVVDREAYKSIYSPGKLLLLGCWASAEAAGAWQPAQPGSGNLHHRRVRIIRDYGMFDRREAPQYYPSVRR